MTEPTKSKAKEHAASEATPKINDHAVAPDEIGQHTQNYIEAYHAISEWIRFADAKAAVILTVGGAMAGLLIPTVHQAVDVDQGEHLFPFWQPVVVGLFILYVAFLLLSGIFAFLCINPFRQKGRHPSLEHCQHFHPAAIASEYKDRSVEDFARGCDDGGQAAMLREVQAAILFDSFISTIKYDKVKMSLKMFAVSVFFGFVYFILLQF